MISVAPTILVATPQELRERVQAIAPYFTRAQIDVLNNTFVSETSFADPDFVESLGSKLTFEIDLMVSVDEYDLEQWRRPWVDMIAFHIEATRKPAEHIAVVKSWGKRVFLALNPETEADAVSPYVKDVDGVLCMTVTPGKSGNPFQTEVLEKIQFLRKKYPKLDIEADGGVSADTLPSLLSVGVTGVAVGSYLAADKMEERSLALLSVIERHSMPPV